MINDTVVITDCDLPKSDCESTLSASGLRPVRANAQTEAEVIDAVNSATHNGQRPCALIVQWAPITAAVLDAVGGAGGVRIISRMGIGCDMVDEEAATERGIAVANTPTYCIEEVASHTIAMILTLSRELHTYDRALRSGSWAPTAGRALRPSSSTVAVIGYGRIGSQVAQHCQALGYRVIVNDPYADPSHIRAAGHESVSFEEALDRADLLTLHAPLSTTTHHLIDANALRATRAGVRIVNTCRGPLIDEAALAAALTSGQVGSAALDVYANEPLPEDSPLRSLENVVLTPHSAWFSPEALTDLPIHTAQNVIDFLAGRDVNTILNPHYEHALSG